MTERGRKLSQEEIRRFWEQERSPGEEVSRLRLRQTLGHWKVRFNTDDRPVQTMGVECEWRREEKRRGLR